MQTVVNNKAVNTKRNHNMNFEVKGKRFQAGYYTAEPFGKNGVMTYWLVFSKPFAAKNPVKVSNSCHVLNLFESLPDGATINKHL